MALLEFTNCCKEVRKALRADKRAWLERKGQEVQSCADRGNLKEVFGASQQICRNWSPQLTKLVSSTGVNLRTKEERLERWTEHFSQLLNPSTSSCSTRLDPEEAAESLSIDLSPIRFEEVLEAVRRLKNGNTSGPDNISSEMLKAHKGIVEWLWDIIDKCWSTEVLPDDWKVAEIVPFSIVSTRQSVRFRYSQSMQRFSGSRLKGRAVRLQKKQRMRRSTLCAASNNREINGVSIGY